MKLREQAEKTAEAFAASFLDDVYGHDLFLGSQIEQVLSEKVYLIYKNIEDPSFFGAAVSHQYGDKFVVLNTYHPLRIRYFTAAHELWHLSEASQMQKENFDHERAADRFAACLMLPKPLVKSLWKRFKSERGEEQSVLAIADLSSAPYKTVERRITEIGESIKVSHSETEWEKLREKYALPESPLDSSMPITKFHAYEKQVLSHVKKGLNPLTASNKLKTFAPSISESLRAKGETYE
ncbi:ImmA/IrrE family metallo-endopeptidase [Kurthia gibsonii]|uniref:ImmA/IrrE family metallo-endopeptidase n=1 Tax=Kurthia gibsonii TaxID=33946 RepID=UPI0031B71BC4